MSRNRSNWIYWLLLIYITLSAVLSTEQSDCDFDDLECLEDFTPTSTYSYVTSSSSSYGQPSSTVTATSSDILSDFHEAKLVHPKPQDPSIPKRPDTPSISNPESSVQDNINQDQDLGSSTETLLQQDKQMSALSNVEAGVLSACGVLVVAGIAVGIFVWKNTTRRRNLRRNHDMPMMDIESNANGDDTNHGGNNMKERLGALGGKDILDVSMSRLQNQGGSGLKAVITLPNSSFDRGDFFSNWQRRNQQGNDDNFEYEPKPKLPEVEIFSENNTTTTAVLDLTLQLPSSEEEVAISEDNNTIDQQTKFQNLNQPVNIEENDDLKIFSKLESDVEISKADDTILTSDQLRGSNYGPLFAEAPNVQANSTTVIPSALDPSYDPTALTYPLQKFLQTPTLNTSSPMQISINVGSDDDDTDGDTDQDHSQENNQVENDVGFTATQHQSIPKSDTGQSPQLREIIADNKGLLGTPLSQHLNKLLRHPSAERQRIVSTGSSSKMVEISLKDDTINVLPHQQHLASPRLNNILGKFTKEPLPTFDENTEMAPSNLEQAYNGRERDKLGSSNEKGPAQLFIDDYKKKYLEEHGKPFMSPLDLPDDQYVPLRDAAGPPLISRAEVLADPVRRLGEDEIALWEQSCRKKELRRLSYEMWDEQALREGVEAYDRKQIARYYGVSEQQSTSLTMGREEEAAVTTSLPIAQGNNRDQQLLP